MYLEKRYGKRKYGIQVWPIAGGRWRRQYKTRARWRQLVWGL